MRPIAYRASMGVLTIGWDHTGPDVVQGLTIDRAQAERLLRDDLHDAERVIQRLKVLSLVPVWVWVPLAVAVIVGLQELRISGKESALTSALAGWFSVSRITSLSSTCFHDPHGHVAGLRP
ncbi:glycoside hydrolase family protein [Pseudomonas cavernicola]|uniref:glycoside hydrolase family protein n=1 Tax=Pseudomonas cavernicola TaxID=2320866 RepID=UPI003B75D20E